MNDFNDRREITFPERRSARSAKSARPLRASTYYVLAVSISAAFFFLVWGILQDNGVETPWITSGLSSSMLLAGAVIMREVILRRARNRFIRQQRLADNRHFDVHPRSADRRNPDKLTIERNSAILSQIRQKSDAARVLNKFSAGHKEVFELCHEYLMRNDFEIKTLSSRSPRLEPLLKGRAMASEYHRSHLIKWAEIEARAFTNDAVTKTTADEKLEAANKALKVIETALNAYPAEADLLASRDLVLEMALSITLSSLVEEAEKAAFVKDYSAAERFYRDALFYLDNDMVQSADREKAAKHIFAEIQKLRDLQSDGV
ncbi:MAG: hypothetical protein ACKVQJ_06215 [Pyrinomonadaceae bacterium]